MNFNDFINPELLVLIPASYLIGIWIKHITFIDNKYIPLILGGFCAVLACLYQLAIADFNGTQSILLCLFAAITQGILCAGASVYVNQIIKQNFEK